MFLGIMVAKVQQEKKKSKLCDVFTKKVKMIELITQTSLPLTRIFPHNKRFANAFLFFLAPSARASFDATMYLAIDKLYIYRPSNFHSSLFSRTEKIRDGSRKRLCES